MSKEQAFPRKNPKSGFIDDEELRKMFPSSFGAHKAAPKTSDIIAGQKRKDIVDELSKQRKDEVEFIGPPRPNVIPSDDINDDLFDTPAASSKSKSKNTSNDNNIDEEDDDKSNDKEDQDVNSSLPISHEIKLAGHNKSVSALALDSSGSRLLTGGNDYIVKFWDFATMDRSLRSFREIEPYSGYPMSELAYNMSSELFVAVPDYCRAKIYNRDGFEQAEFIKGDQYLLDMKNTKGHVASITGAMWHPGEKQTILTCSHDSTLRIWDANTVAQRQKTVIKVKNQKGTKTTVTSCSYSPDGALIAAGCGDGSIQVWKSAGPYENPHAVSRTAHAPGSDITSVNISRDGNTLISRSCDDTLKVWDIRKFTKPLQVFEDLVNFSSRTDCIFSPLDDLILTGTSVKKNEGSGLLVFIDKQTLSLKTQIGVSSGSVVRVLWHHALNQILVGSSDNLTHVFFDPLLSKKGALYSMSREARKPNPADFTPGPMVVAPHALPMYRPEPNQKRARQKARVDPKKSKIPENTITGEGHGGKVGTSTAHFLMQEIGITKNTTREQDPREELLKYAQVAEENPLFIKAYQKTQPKPVFDYTEYQNEEEEKQPLKKRKF